MRICKGCGRYSPRLVSISPIAQTVTQRKIVVLRGSHDPLYCRVYESVRLNQDDVGAIWYRGTKHEVSGKTATVS